MSTESPSGLPEKKAPEASSPKAWFWLPVMLTLVLLLPFYVERFSGAIEKLQYANTRGRQRAMSEDARTQLASLEQTSDAFRLVARSVEPSVVHIDTVRTGLVTLESLNRFRNHDSEATAEGEQDGPTDDAEEPDRPARKTRQHGDSGNEDEDDHSQGQGSGLIVDNAGYILTNYHVVRSASQIQVRLSDGRVLPRAALVGYDRMTDLAVLKIDAEGLSSCPWGDSGTVEVGDWVLAMGNPFGLDRSMTAGIVSAKRRRQVVRDMTFPEFIQTDASVNPGSSGGPLLNLKGEVVGINTAIVGQSYQGISFAIPSDIARDVFQRLRSEGHVIRGWLGVSLQEAADVIAEKSAPLGAQVLSVFPGSPADLAGIQVGDVIVRWNDLDVVDSVDLRLRVSRSAVGQSVPALIRRGDEQLAMQVTVAERPKEHSK
ncbi:MAG: S1C family serine protease [Pirellulales bacterium]